MSHAWHTMLDLDNPEMIENWKVQLFLLAYFLNQILTKRVNESQIYENVPYINGVIAPKTYGLQVRVLLKCFLKIVGTIYSAIIDNFQNCLSSIFIPLGRHIWRPR